MFSGGLAGICAPPAPILALPGVGVEVLRVAPPAIVRLGGAGVNGEDKGVYYPLDKAEDWPLQFAMRLGVKAKALPRLIVFAGVRYR